MHNLPSRLALSERVSHPHKDAETPHGPNPPNPPNPHSSTLHTRTRTHTPGPSGSDFTLTPSYAIQPTPLRLRPSPACSLTQPRLRVSQRLKVAFLPPPRHSPPSCALLPAPPPPLSRVTCGMDGKGGAKVDRERERRRGGVRDKGTLKRH